MTYVKRFLGFWYDFIIGDDWTIAVGVVGGLVLTGVLARRGRLVADAAGRDPPAGCLALARGASGGLAGVLGGDMTARTEQTTHCTQNQ